MALSQVNIPRDQSGGKGGLFGKILGGLAGAIAAPFTGGASIPAGMAIGGTIGEIADPAKISQGVGVSTLDTASKIDPMVQNGLMKNAQKSLATDPRYSPDQAKELYDYLEAARQKNQQKTSLGAL